MLALAVIALTQFAPTVADAPNREPRFAVSGHTVALAYGSGNGIYVATSLNDGRTFGKPVEVGTAPVVPLSRHRGPRDSQTMNYLSYRRQSPSILKHFLPVPSFHTHSILHH